MPRKQNQTKIGKVKSGTLSVREIAQIKKMMHTETADQIGSKLQRSVNQVKAQIAKIKGVEIDAIPSLKNSLESRPEWRLFEEQFTYDELQHFKHLYVQLMCQFSSSGDVLPAEELQVFQVITLKIQIDRALKAQRRALDDTVLAETKLAELRNEQQILDRDNDLDEYNKVVEEMVYWSSVLENGKRTNAESVGQYKVYSDKQDKMLVTLKSTRDQRIKIFENSDKSILGFIRLLVQEDQREIKGKEAEMMKLASQKEKRRLAQPHQFADGVVDRPILTAETVFYEDEQEDITFPA